MSGAPRAGLLAIGNELLNGDIQDQNLFTLIRRLTRLGFLVEQAAIARDDSRRIAALLYILLEQRPQVILISGGLGPTGDDLTLAALAEALELPLEEQPQARALVEAHYDRLLAQGYLAQRGPEAARRKMATLPHGATPLPNPIGTAPGVRLEHGESLLYCLPGVPAELLAIYDATIEPELQARFARGVWVEQALIARCNDEADVAAPLREVVARHPDVYIKSLAQPFPDAQEAGLRIIAAARAATQAEGEARVAAALTDLQKTLERAKIETSTP